MPNPMEKILEGDGAIPVPEIDDKEEKIKSLEESVNALSETVETLTGQISEKSEPQVEEEWKPDTWKDVESKAEEKAREVVERTLDEKQTEQENYQREEAEALKAIDKDYDQQVANMEKEGLIPPIKDRNNPNDPGMQSRRELFGFAAAHGTPLLTKVGKDLAELHKNGIYYSYDPNTGDGQFIRTRTSGYGQSVPVGSSSSRTGGSGRQLNYQDLHRRSMDSLIEKYQ